MLIVFGGLPGTGKTTVARALASRMGAVYLRIESLEHAFIAAVELRRWLRIGGVVVFGTLVGLVALALTSVAGGVPPALLVVGGGCVVALMVLFAVLHRQV